MTDFPDWGSILPSDGMVLSLDADPDFKVSRPSVVRGLYTTLEALASALPERDHPSDPVSMYFDVIRVDSAVQIATDKVVIHARRIEVTADAAIGLIAPAEPAGPEESAEPGATAEPGESNEPVERTLEIHTAELVLADEVDALPVSVVGFPYEVTARIGGHGLVLTVAADGSVSIEETARPARGDALAGQVHLIGAKRLAYDKTVDPDRTLAVAMADWVAGTAGDPVLAADARSWSARLRTPIGDAHYVPYLQMAEYERLVQTTLEALDAVERHYADLFGQDRNIEAEQRAVKRLRSEYDSALAYSKRLMNQAADEAAKAMKAVEDAQQKVDDRRAESDQLEDVFQQGIEDKRAELEREAIFGIVVGVGLLAAGIATVWFSGPAGGAAAAAGAAQVASAGAKAAETAKRIEKLIKLIKKIAAVLDAMKKVKGYYDQLKAIFDSIADPIKAREMAAQAGRSSPEPLDSANVMNAADWDEFSLTLDAAFGPAIDQGINGAVDYKVGMKKLGLRGKSLVVAQTNLDRAQREFQQRVWQTMRDQDQIDQLDVAIAQLDKNRRPGSMLMTHYAGLRDQLKFRLIFAIERLADAYRYYALEDPEVTPTMSASGAELAKMISDLSQALVEAKERRGEVQSWGDRLEQETASLEPLREQGAISLMIGPENFDDLDRIRIHAVRVWLRGEGVKTVRVDIATSGEYLDRLGGDSFRFMARPLYRAFKYSADDHSWTKDPWGRPVRITLDADDSEGEFFEPTAFTTWTISLPDRYNRDLDRSDIEEIILEFEGTARPRREAAAAGRMALGAEGEPIRIHTVVQL